MPYTNCVSFNQALNELNLFDDIKGKYLKSYFNQSIDLDEYDIEVEIKDVIVEGENDWTCNVEITFELDNPDYNPNSIFTADKERYTTFTKEVRYNSSSAFALTLLNLYMERSDEEESDEEDEDEDISQYKKMCIYFECQDGEKEIVDLSNWILEDGTGNDEMFFDECEEPCFVDRELERYVCLEYIKNNLVE